MPFDNKTFPGQDHNGLPVENEEYKSLGLSLLLLGSLVLHDNLRNLLLDSLWCTVD